MGVRAETRQRMTSEVLRIGRQQLAEVGAPGLSLRAIARELGVVSSAVYRYFPSRDALLTALIVDAYNEFGMAAEQAESVVPRDDLLGRIRAVAGAMREWALDHPNEYALIYGSPVPGYAAPEETIVPASRIPVLLIEILRDQRRRRRAAPFDARATRAITPLQQTLAADVDPQRLSLGFTLWEFLLGAVSLEVFGHQENVLADDLREEFFIEQVRVMAALVLGK